LCLFLICAEFPPDNSVIFFIISDISKVFSSSYLNDTCLSLQSTVT